MTKLPIPTFKLEFDTEFRREFKERCDRIFDEAFFTDHTLVEEFERAFAAFSGMGHATAVSNGTAALEAALLAIAVHDKEVLLPTNTFIATAAAVEAAGGVPVALDIEEEFFGLCPEELERALSPETGAVIAVHVGGLISPAIEEISRICSANGVPLIEDCAHAHGCSLNGRPAGSFGVAGCFSFFPTKVITAGEGGMILTEDRELDQKLKSVRRFGRDPDQPISHLRAGNNFKMTEFQALLGSMDLTRSPARIRRRMAHAEHYRARLQNSAWKAITPPENSVCTHYKQVVLSPLPRGEVEEALAARGISLTGGVYFMPLHRQPYYRERFREESFPVADRFADGHICPPCYPELTPEEIDRVCDALLELHP